MTRKFLICTLCGRAFRAVSISEVVEGGGEVMSPKPGSIVSGKSEDVLYPTHFTIDLLVVSVDFSN